MKRSVFWLLFWVFIAFALLAALDNLFFQPAMPGLIIGIFALSSTILLLIQAKRIIRS